MALPRLGAMIGVALGVGTIAMAIRQRRRSERQPHGLADADLSEEERKAAAARMSRLRRGGRPSPRYL